jgi:putative transposase
VSKLREIEIGKYYHSYSRGIDSMNIFLDHFDYLVFQEMIEKFNVISPRAKKFKLVEIFCYTLMPNHFHFVLKGLVENGASKFLQKVLGQYANYFNRKYNRKGPLFESRFKDKVIDSDDYFEHLIGYIWNNPIKIINSKYKSEYLYNQKIKLSKKEKRFALNYPYKKFPDNYLGPEHKKLSKINFESFDF